MRHRGGALAAWPSLLRGVLPALALAISGCSSPGGSSLAGLILGATPTATATQTPLPTPTSTPTPTPTPEPLRLSLELDPELVSQGGVATIRLRASRALREARGALAGRTLTFLREGATAWSLAGFRSDAPLGPQTISVAVTAEGGATAQATGALEVVAGSFRIERIRVPPGQEGLLDPGVLQQEWNQLLALTRQVSPEKRWQGAFLLPAQGDVTSLYGTRRAYNDGPPGGPHEGLDLGAEVGAPVVAANAGVVALARTWPVRGNVVVIDHGLGVFSGYYHLSELLVAEGQRVARGAVIGRVGETGLATGPHLHWDMVVQGMHTAPLEWTLRAYP